MGFFLFAMGIQMKGIKWNKYYFKLCNIFDDVRRRGDTRHMEIENIVYPGE